MKIVAGVLEKNSPPATLKFVAVDIGLDYDAGSGESLFPSQGKTCERSEQRWGDPEITQRGHPTCSRKRELPPLQVEE